MNELSEHLIATKIALMSALGENVQKYLSNMKMWFRHKWSKEEFDYESRKLLTPEDTHLHNQFLIAMLNKIDAFQLPNPTSVMVGQQSMTASASGGSGSSTRSRKRKRTSRGTNERVSFEPYDFFDFIIEDNIECIRPAAGTETYLQMPPTPRYCADELFLPDSRFILGRFLIGAWESGLTTADDGVSDCIVIAVQTLLKNLISAIIMNKKHYKVTGEGSFYFDIGAPLRDPSLRNTVTRQKVDDSPLELDKEITSPSFMRRSNDDGAFLSACEEVIPQRNNLITLKDAFLGLSSDHNLLSSHWVYSTNMERMTQLMH